MAQVGSISRPVEDKEITNMFETVWNKISRRLKASMLCYKYLQFVGRSTLNGSGWRSSHFKMKVLCQILRMGTKFITKHYIRISL